METEDGTKWILSISMGLPEENAGKPIKECGFGNVHVMQYYVGEFDGDTFIDTQKSKLPLLLDYGTDNYAAVTFSNMKEQIMLGWGENWDYVSETPSQGYRGKMTLARRLSLAKTPFGYRLKNEPFGIEQLPEVALRSTGDVLLDENCFYMRIVLNPGEEIVFENTNKDVFSIRMMEREIIVDRSHAGNYGFSKKLAEERYHILHVPRLEEGSSQMELIYDEGYFEFFADGGLLPFSVMTYVEQGYEKATLHKMA